MSEAALSNSVLLSSGLFAIGLAIVHLLSGRLRFLRSVPRSRWLSFGGGVSVAYVFIHILPELTQAQATIQNTIDPGFAFLEHHVYLVALLGLVIFYALERSARVSRRRNQQAGAGDRTDTDVFWTHMVAFALYNALIGYLLIHREQTSIFSLLLFAVAMALHFIVNDYGLRENHKAPYDKIGRWILAAAIGAGWVIGSATQIHAAAIAVLFAFLAGGVVLNVLKEELPEERESRFWAFALGASAYAALLLAG